MKNKILGEQKKSNFDDNLADIVNELAEKGELVKSSEQIELPPVDLSKLDFELSADGAMWSFDDSLKDLREDRFRGEYTRHPRPREVFELLQTKSIEWSEYNGFLVPDHEWTSCALKKEGNKLFVALDPENLAFDFEKKSYIITGSDLSCSEVKEFDIGDKPLNNWIKLDKFPQELINYLYGSAPRYVRPFSIYNYDPKLKFLKEGIWLPVIRSKCSLAQDYFALSRGVKVEK